MKSKTWLVQLSIWQRKTHGRPIDYGGTYRVRAQRAGTAINRALWSWQRSTHKRIGSATSFTVHARVER